MGGFIRFDHVSLCFRLYREKVDTLKEAVLGRFRHEKQVDQLWAVRDASFGIEPGESVGLIGDNGSGKSTLLRIAAGVLKPTRGTVSVSGRIAPMIELAAGFDGDLTGRDNVYLNGALMGYRRREMAAKFERIVQFSELGDFIDQPVKNYSSGMYARLGFAIAADVEPDILIIDEVLAVGDERFQTKCMERIHAIRSRSCTILYVSHSLESVRELCDRAMVMQHGQIVFDGPPESAISAYRQLQPDHASPRPRGGVSVR
jgi:ABC-type polysaccharide/polyol phosphate transport system ATPase subunit